MAFVKTLKILGQQFRISEWTKNGFVFAGLIFSGNVFDISRAEKALAAFFLFCALSSIVYVFNDLSDLNEDKRHPIKKNRPFAAGSLPVWMAKYLILVLLPFTLFLCYCLNNTFFIWASCYLLLNLLYTVFLKRIVLVDILAVSTNYIIRVLAGAAAVNVPITPYFIIASTLLALFLAIGKRRYELQLLGDKAATHRSTLAKYSLRFLDNSLIAVAIVTLVVYGLYSFDSHTEQLLHTRYMSLTIPFVAFGIFRYVWLVRSGITGGNPAHSLLNDLSILLTVVFWLITVVSILYLSH